MTDDAVESMDKVEQQNTYALRLALGKILKLTIVEKNWHFFCLVQDATITLLRVTDPKIVEPQTLKTITTRR